MNDHIPIINCRDQEEPPPPLLSSIVDYHRLPQVWQSRALNFNKNIVKKITNAEKCCLIEKPNFKMKFKQDIVDNFCHSTESTRSITPNSSSLMCLSTEHLIKPTSDRHRHHNYHHHYNHYHNQRLYKSAMNFDRRFNYYKTSKNQNPYFIRFDNHGQPTKFSKHQMPHKWFSSRDIRRDYHQIPSSSSYSWFPSATYFYPNNMRINRTIFQPTNNHGLHHLYSSQTFYPGAYFPTTTTSTKIYPTQPIRMSYSHHPYNATTNQQLPIQSKSEFNNNNRQCKLLSKASISSSSTNTNGHIIVLVIILSVIAIGVVMGLILAITIN
ncbi:hypothetical protein DERP_004457 [Dermatophagoides pteronyssinus]|uniref:GATA zinc finger domain-containing protein 14-like n=1 Tax=Dermatophagoides pteronyssinus TaxID=6956 RepID=A0ABQ8JP83_DERPT|nr:hypothetical protein DERP_004457 [Dermatophagoides pteronyssinus]